MNKGNGLNYELKKGDDLFSVNLERKTAILNGSSFSLPKDLKAGNKWFSDLGKLETTKKASQNEKTNISYCIIYIDCINSYFMLCFFSVKQI